MNLQLNRPIVFFDLETTGLNISSDRIVEFSYIKVFPTGEEQSGTFRLNPEMHIPAAATAVHHISDVDVADCPTLRDMAQRILDIFADSDVVGYNSNHFDVPMLTEQLSMIGYDFNVNSHRYVDVQAIFHKKEQRTLSAAYRFYCNSDLEGAHSANADTKATYEVLKAQLDRYPDLKNTVDFLSDYTSKSNKVDLAGRIVRDEQGRERFSFGKHKDRLVEEIFVSEPSYYDWMMKGEFPNNTKQVITEIFNRVKPGRAEYAAAHAKAATEAKASAMRNSLHDLAAKYPSKSNRKSDGQQSLF